MECYAKAVLEPKRVQWDDTGHKLNDPQARQERAAWLCEKSGLDALASTAEKR